MYNRILSISRGASQSQEELPVSSSSAKENYYLSFHFAGAAASSERGQLHPQPPSTPASTTIDILGEFYMSN